MGCPPLRLSFFLLLLVSVPIVNSEQVAINDGDLSIIVSLDPFSIKIADNSSNSPLLSSVATRFITVHLHRSSN